MGSNIISEIDSGTFSKMKNLKSVILADNKLTELHENVFSAQERLVELDLAHNQLTTFDLGAIGSTWYLTQINLAQNNMQSLRKLSTLSWKPNRTSINVTGNQWNCFTAELLEKIASKNKCELIGNIFNCSSNWLASTLENLKIQQHNIKKFNATQRKYRKNTAELRQTLAEQDKKINDLVSVMKEMKHKMTMR
jgi:Leucine rich repeat